MAKHLAWTDAAKINRHLEKHDEQIGELLEMSAIDRKAVKLHGRELRLLRELSEVQSLRITHVTGAVARIARRVARRRR